MGVQVPREATQIQPTAHKMKTSEVVLFVSAIVWHLISKNYILDREERKVLYSTYLLSD